MFFRNILKKIGEYMKKIFKKFKPDDPPAGGVEPKAEPKTDPVDIGALTEKIRNELKKEFEEEQKKKEELQKLDENARLKKEKADLEAKILEMENSAKAKSFEAGLRDFAAKAGASKFDALVKLADRSKTPEEAVNTLKKDYPELFAKPLTPSKLGAGVTGSSKGEISAEEAEKMSMEEFEKWRNAK